MGYSNGRLPSSLLTTVEPNTLLLKRDAPVYRAFKMFAADRKRTLSIANAGRGGGGGYRTWTMQDRMHLGSLGNLKWARLYDLNPNSSVKVAAAGYSTHGRDDHARIDLVGTDLGWILNHMVDFGARREFGAADPNHVILDGAAANRWRHSVPATAVATTGRVGGPGSAFRKRVQVFARLGGYDGPPDGVEGDNTWNGVDTELRVGRWGHGIAGLQRWAGVDDKDVVITEVWKNVPPSSVRAVARKLNRL